MIKPKFLNIHVLVMLLLLCNCTKPVDFNQVDDLVITPVVESSLIFYTAKAEDFFIGGSEQSTAEDFVEIDLFNGSFIQENLVKVEFVFEIENSINRAYQLRLRFLDVNGQVLESFNVNTAASPNNQTIATVHTEVFEGISLERLKQSRILEFTLVMQPGEPISQDTPGEINVKSKGVFSLNID